MLVCFADGGTPNSSERSCYDCHWCQAAISWWCVNEAASKARGSKIPGGSQCSFWKPLADWNSLTSWQKFKLKWGGDFMLIDLSEKANTKAIS